MPLDTSRNKAFHLTYDFMSTNGKSKIIFNSRLIKDYDGGTLMEAFCNPEIDYTNLSNTIKKQKEHLKNLTRNFLNVKRRNNFDQLEKILKKNCSNV